MDEGWGSDRAAIGDADVAHLVAEDFLHFAATLMGTSRHKIDT